jgi:photosystem II stability/assembly factor-like uncharacterized protein
MTDDFERDPLERDVRDSLARHAASAPPGDALAERIIQAASHEPAGGRQPRRGWRTWALPLAAVGAVAAVVAAVIGIESYHPTASGPANSGSPAPSILQTPEPTPSPSSSTTSAPSPTATTPIGAPDLTGVKILDLTFAYNEGWALASADCPAGTCTALLRTTDGTNWQSVSVTPFNVPGITKGCTYPCVSNIRFATADTGYVFGPHAFLMTTDGGKSWTPQPGGAIALETLSGNVIRVTSSHSGCPSWCDVQVETSAIGSTSWTPATLGTTPGFGVQLARGGHNAYLLFLGHPTGGAEGSGKSVLYRSTDDGQTWQSVGEPCPQASGEVDSWAIAGGGDDVVSVLCANRQDQTHLYLAASSDAGASFTAKDAIIPGTPELLAGDPMTVLVAAGSDGMARSTDGGKTWQSVPDVTGQVTWVGFESQKVGRAVTDNRVIWTTQDGGATWEPVQFK